MSLCPCIRKDAGLYPNVRWSGADEELISLYRWIGKGRELDLARVHLPDPFSWDAECRQEVVF